ncbi:MAG: hypothetical protein AAF605_04415 [Myxococcota bacterium]|mgnify:CR=1 FL=1
MAFLVALPLGILMSAALVSGLPGGRTGLDVAMVMMFLTPVAIGVVSIVLVASRKPSRSASILLLVTLVLALPGLGRLL